MIEAKLSDLLKNIKEEMAKPVVRPSFSQNNQPGQVLSLAQAVQNRLLRDLRSEEKKKYPSPPYTYQTKNVDAAGGSRVVHVTYNGTKPTPDNLNTMQLHSYAVRRLSILGGIMHGLEFSELYLSSDKDQRTKIYEMINKQITNTMTIANSGDIDSSQDSHLERFIKALGDGIAAITGEDPDNVINKVRRAECYFVAEYRNPILINETKLADNSTAISMDISLGNPLSLSQRQEFYRIHSDDNQPSWFKRLSFWEQNWFEKNIPKHFHDEVAWHKFENISQTSGMTHMPGLQNARMHYLLKSDDNGPYRLLSSSMKNGSLDPYDMPSDERLKHVKDNAEQAMQILAEHANEKFHDQWGDIFAGKIRPFILVQSLLSDTSFNPLDVRLVREQAQAAQDAYYQHAHNRTHLFGQVNLVIDNAPVNMMRLISAEVGSISKAVGRWDGTDNIINAAKDMITALEDIFAKGETPVTDEQKKQIEKKLILMRKLCIEIENIRKSVAFTHIFKNQNITAIKAVYSQLLVEAMGGAVATNCKSGKDRTGLDEALRDAVMLHYDEYGEIPPFNANNSNYLNTFVKLYDSMKIHEAGAMNTPGSFGINDKARMLHLIARAELQDSYDAGTYRSLWNKLGFKPYEAKDSNQLKLEEEKQYYLSTRDEFIYLTKFLNEISMQLANVSGKKYESLTECHKNIISRDLTQLSAVEMINLHQEIRKTYDKTFNSSQGISKHIADAKNKTSYFFKEKLLGQRRGSPSTPETTASLTTTNKGRGGPGKQ